MDAWDWDRRIDESKYSSTELPTYPVRTLVGHVAIKGVQAGAFLGLVVGVPVISYLRKLPLKQAWRKVMPIAPVVGTFLSLAGLYGLNYSKPMGVDGIDDRAFRIMHNKGQVSQDQCSIVGGAVGAAFGTVVVPGVVPVLAAASTGVALGCVYQKWDVYKKDNPEWAKQWSDIEKGLKEYLPARDKE